MRPIVLASRSLSRAAVLSNAGLTFEAVGSGVDEAAEKARLQSAGAGPRDVAEALASLKALAISRREPEALVIGADQTLDLAGALLDKAEGIDAARERLMALRGRAHTLHSSVAAALGGQVVWSVTESPILTMRAFSDGFLDAYLENGGEMLLDSVGCYLLEGEGAQLFETIEGDYFAVLGLPLLPLLTFLRDEGVLPA